ncbi:tubulin polyglutamylase TTLL4 isoform X1 [Solea senegalensis]|uniref:Tubulin polyglutamylase TTLL4 isoform X1 n=1 Tax=Solea senegalensis TaxID=28829 RepID=A0AAV6REX5_SOLSE|nr:tubulin polyglutamylase TTLL4 isoform X1 [Solea senegalensis]XP_043871226.1 tubulin polyglutamylase TTLL4 isoform X1 [Solea senegalensis]KAG7503946.1 tubulin polyglutamylase TTLL4 isoform X1 [Solea senegalensis]
MPTNQSSPWGGGKSQACSNAQSSTTTASVNTHAKALVATKMPFGQTSLQLSRQKDQAKPPLSNFASSTLRQTTVAPSEASVREDGGKYKSNPQSQVTAVPDRSPALPQLTNGIQILNQAPPTGLKQAGYSFMEINASSSITKKECHVGLNGPPTSAMQVDTSRQPEKVLPMSRRPAAPNDVPLGLDPLLSVCNQDLFIKGQSTLQETDKSMFEATDCSSLPSVPPPCLTLSEQRGATLRRDAPSPVSTKLQKRSTTRETTTSRRCHSAKLAKKSSRFLNGRTILTDSRSHLQVRGRPPAVLAATVNSKPQILASLDTSKQSQDEPESTSSIRGGVAPPPPEVKPFPNSPMPIVLSARINASQEQQPVVIPGTLVGSVTTQISAIQLTKQGQPASMSPSSSSLSSSSPLPTEGGPGTSGQESVMQVDGVEEELPDECSEEDSDTSSVNDTSSTASIGLLSGIEEPMSLGAEDAREELPALVPSLFPHVSPTLYFCTANERVEMLPVEQRRLLKWKMSTVTPNVVKHTIARSHFRITKKSNDWLGCWGHHMRSAGFKTLAEHQKLNHFPGTFQIGRKDRLWRNLSKMQGRFGKPEFSFFPRTFILPQDIKQLRKAWENGSSRQKWIIKPPASARGTGIQVIHKWSQMPRKRPLLVQRYLHKPYLIGGNKFDLRIYVYVTCYDPLRIYIFTDGLVRFASCKYSSSMKTLSNKFIHLTNYSVNKQNSEYQSNSDDKACQGHKWALKALWQYLGSQGIDTTPIWEKIKDIVIKTVIASEPYVTSSLKTNVRSPYSCHELLGFDIMLDKDLKPWILEVNISPSLHSNSELDISIKGQMIKDLLNLAGFRIPQREDVVATCSSSASSSTSSLCGGSKERTSKPELSPDEKVKRAFYVTQRCADQGFLSTVMDILTPEDVRILAESEDEMNRLGDFERVFPSPTSSRYLRFFECPRYLNILMDQWEQKHWSNRAKGVSQLQALCEKGVHLGTSDPAHIWSKCSYISKFEPQKQNPDSQSSVVVVSQSQCSLDDTDGEVASVSSLPVSPSPGSSVASSACTSPQPSCSHSVPP